MKNTTPPTPETVTQPEGGAAVVLQRLVREDGGTDQTFFWKGRVLVWFSCGAASAVAAKLAADKYRNDNLEVLYCQTPDATKKN